MKDFNDIKYDTNALASEANKLYIKKSSKDKILSARPSDVLNFYERIIKTDISPYRLRQDVLKLLEYRENLKRTRVMRQLVDRGAIQPETTFGGKGDSDGYGAKPFVYNGYLYRTPKLWQYPKKRGGINRDRRKNFLQERMSRYEQQFRYNFVNPRVYADAHILHNTDVMPALERRPREDDVTYFKHNLDLTVHAGWDEMQKLSTDKFLYAGRIKNKTEDELLENDVRVCQVWAWEKGAIREFHARSTRKCIGESIEIPLIPLVLAYNHTSSSLVTNRSRAIQSIRLKTKNRVVTSLWDT
jgi:hypothetical protein